MCNSIFNGCFCVVFHCNTYELYRQFSIQIVIHTGLLLHVYACIAPKLVMYWLFVRVDYTEQLNHSLDS